MRHRIAKMGLCVAGCTMGAVAISWPLLPQASVLLTSGRATSDLGYAVFAQWWMGEALAGNGSFFDCPLVYFPDGQNLASSVWNVLALAITAPLHWFVEPMTAWNLSIIGVASLNGLAAFGLGHRLGGKTGGVTAAAVMLSAPWMWMELFEGRLEQGLLVPLVLYIWALLNLAERRPRAWLTAGLTMGLIGACYWFMAIIAAITTLPLLGRKLLQRDVLKDLIRAAGVSVIIALPFFALVAPHAFSSEFAEVATDARRTFDMRITHSVSPVRALIAHIGPANQAVPLVVLTALLAGLRWAPARSFLGVIGVALALAAGPALAIDHVPMFVGGGLLPLPMWALDIIPGFGRFIWPSRAIAVVVVATCGVAAVVMSQLRGRPLQWIGCVALVLLFLEGRGLVLQSAMDTDASLPSTAFDPPPEDAFFTHRTPEWMTRIPADSGAIISLPLSDAHSWAPMFIPTHKHPIAAGDGASELGLQPTPFKQRTREITLLQAWRQGTTITETMAGDVPKLKRLGFSWVTQFRGESDPAADAQAETLQALFGSPVSEEANLTVWAIR